METRLVSVKRYVHLSLAYHLTEHRSVTEIVYVKAELSFLLEAVKTLARKEHIELAYVKLKVAGVRGHRLINSF